MDILIGAIFFAAFGFVVWKTGLLDKFTKPKDSVTPAKPNPPVFTPAPVVPIRPDTPADSNELQVFYPNEEALRAFILRTQYNGTVTLDDEQINGGFGPAAKFVTQMDGSVRR